MLMPWQGVLTFAVVGVLLMIVAGGLLLRDRSLRRRGRRTHGVIVAQDEHFATTGGGLTISNRSSDKATPTRRPWAIGTGDANLVQTPIVEFMTADGRAIRTRPRVSSSVSSFVPGRVVTLFYDRNAPEEVVIAGYAGGALLSLGFAGLVALGFAVVMLLFPGEALQPGIWAAIPVVLGATMLAIGAAGIGRVWSIHRNGTVTTGTVVGETTSSTREGLTLHHPVVRFSVTSGHEVQAPAERGTLRRRARAGQSVTIRYDPADPYRMLLAGDGARPVFWIFTLVGVVTLAVATAITVFLVRQ
jgi:Protein of unknown function (DUF3592)